MYNTDLPTRAELPSAGRLLRSTVVAALIAAALLVTIILPAEYGIDPTGAGRALGLTQMGEIKVSLAAEASAEASAPAAEVAASPADAAPGATGNAMPSAEVPRAVAMEGGSTQSTQEPARATAPESATAPATIPALATATAGEAVAAAGAGATMDATSTTADGEAASSADAPAAPEQHTTIITLKPDQAAEIKLVMRKDASVVYEWSAGGGRVNYDTHGDPFGAPKNFYHGYGKGRHAAGDSGTLQAAFDGKHGWFWRNRSGAEVTVTLKTSGDYERIERAL